MGPVLFNLQSGLALALGGLRLYLTDLYGPRHSMASYAAAHPATLQPLEPDFGHRNRIYGDRTARTPGELVRPYLISVKERVSFSSQMAAWFLERILDLVLVLIIFGIALARIPAGLHLGPALQWILRMGGYLVASLGALCILLLVVFRNFAVPAQARILSAARVLPEKLYTRLAKILTAFVQGMECTHDFNNLALLMGYTVLEWVVIVSAYFCVFRALPATSHFSLDDVMIFLGIVAFGSVVQIPGIGGGVQVAAFLVLHEIFKISGELATGIAILIWLLSWVLVVPVGLAFAFHEGVNWSKIRHITEDVESGTAAK